MKISFQSPPKNIDEKMVYNILRDYKMLNCEVLVRDEYGTPLLLSFTISQLDLRLFSDCGRLHRCDNERAPEIHQMVSTRLLTQSSPLLANSSSLYVYNKIDSVSIEFLDKLAREPNTVVMSCELDLGIQDVVDRCWDELRLLRIYTKR